MKEEGRTDIAKMNGNYGRKIDVEEAVLQRYQQAAQQVEAGLCVPVDYNTSLLEIIPDEILKKDYGCGGQAISTPPP